jgi:hypothetical protein
LVVNGFCKIEKAFKLFDLSMLDKIRGEGFIVSAELGGGFIKKTIYFAFVRYIFKAFFIITTFYSFLCLEKKIF